MIGYFKENFNFPRLQGWESDKLNSVHGLTTVESSAIIWRVKYKPIITPGRFLNRWFVCR